MTIFAKLDIFIKLKFAVSKNGLWHDHDFKLYNIHDIGVHKIQNTLVIGAKAGDKLSPFFMTAIR